MFNTVFEQNIHYEFQYETPTPEELKSFKIITDELLYLYTEYFGIAPKPFQLINDFGRNNSPITFRNDSIIYVNCPHFWPYQFIFQLTHELCHLMISHDVVDNLRWLEETIAIMSSLFFYNKISSVNQHELFFTYET